jgi:hypothetical protein
VINANADGGPYGLEVLRGVQEYSDRVWKAVSGDERRGERGGWYLATIRINVSTEKIWTIIIAGFTTRWRIWYRVHV